GYPIVFARSYLHAGMFNGLENVTPREIETEALFLLLERRFNVPTLGNQELIAADLASEEVARILEIEPGSPVLCIHMISRTYEEKAYEYRISYANTARWRLHRRM